VRRFTLAGKLALVLGADVLAVAIVAALAAAAGFPPWTVLFACLLAGWPLAVWSLGRFWAPVRQTLAAVTDGVRSFHENDFSLRVVQTRRDELGELVALYNRMGDALQLERNEIYQRELLLDTVVQGAPMAILLVNALHRVTYANVSARRLFGGERLPGRALSDVLAARPELRRAVEEGEDALASWPDEHGGEETYRVLTRPFALNTQRNRLVVLERITPELRRQEVEVWKKAIRVMSHELNNSLAPISSLVHSARTVASRPGAFERLDEIFGSVEERVRHLADFLEGYARFARLPRPRKEPVAWVEFLGRIAPLFPFRCELDGGPSTGWFDAAQMQQVVINLLKNASEAGGPAGEIAVRLESAPDGGSMLSVLDRGPGMGPEAMRDALLPFYSSKPEGGGLGLPLCNEIVSAHGGQLTVQARPGGGTVVTCSLPPGPS
jgi:two-component system nitrogen regulation sensor histidine kinase NtrY